MAKVGIKFHFNRTKYHYFLTILLDTIQKKQCVFQHTVVMDFATLRLYQKTPGFLLGAGVMDFATTSITKKASLSTRFLEIRHRPTLPP